MEFLFSPLVKQQEIALKAKQEAEKAMKEKEKGKTPRQPEQEVTTEEEPEMQPKGIFHCMKSCF